MWLNILFIFTTLAKFAYFQGTYRLVISTNKIHHVTASTLLTVFNCQPECAFACRKMLNCFGFNFYKQSSLNCELFFSNEILDPREFSSFQATSETKPMSETIAASIVPSSKDHRQTESHSPAVSTKGFTTMPVGSPAPIAYDCNGNNPCHHGDKNGARLPYVDDKHYVTCSWQQCDVMPCPPGTLFSSSSEECR